MKTKKRKTMNLPDSFHQQLKDYCDQKGIIMQKFVVLEIGKIIGYQEPAPLEEIKSS
jgi:hypothetical protein